MPSRKGQRGVPRRVVFGVRQAGLYHDVPLEAFASSLNGAAWLRALDALIPATTDLTYTQLFAIIGPPDDTTAQNRRVAHLLGYDLNDPLSRSAGLRLVQRYRRSEQPGVNRKNVRGVSAGARQQLLSDLGPTARHLMLLRFMALTTRYGLAGKFTGWMMISTQRHFYDRSGGVDGESMALARQQARLNNWEDAAEDYLGQWLVQWGPEFENNDLLDVVEVVKGPRAPIDPTWELRLGFPNDIGLVRSSPQLLLHLEDDTLAPYTDTD